MFVCLLLGPTFSSPLAGASDTALRATLPGDLSSIAVDPFADSPRQATEVLDRVVAQAIPDLSASCSDNSDVPLATIAKAVVPANTADTHAGEGSPPSSRLTTGSPRYSAFLHRKDSLGGSGTVPSGNERGKLSSC